MKTGNYFFSSWHFVIILFAGFLSRFIYGCLTKQWLTAPDQLAWGLSIEEMLQNKDWSYKQIIHYPHEGGSLFIAILSILFRPLQFIMPSLSIASLALDTFSRFIQIKVAQKVFGDKTALWFGIWTILSVPAIIPWATVNFGLHCASGFFPFLFLYFVINCKERRNLPIVCGIVSGIAVSFSYDSVVLIIVSIIYFIFSNGDSKAKFINLFKYAFVLIVVLLPHLFSREMLDTGFNLVDNTTLSVRGISVGSFFSFSRVTNLFSTYFEILPGSVLLSSISFISANHLKNLVLIFISAGIIFFLFSKSIQNQTKFLSLIIIIIFIGVYAFSPFYEKNFANKSYVVYRHIAYIIPFLILIMINGLLKSVVFKSFLLIGFIALCGFASIVYINSSKRSVTPEYKATGWVLARKYGNDVSKLYQFHSMAEKKYQDDLLLGFGWGLTVTLLENRNASDTASLEKLIQLINQFSEKDKPLVIDGINHSFKNGITPVLDPALQATISLRLQGN